MKELYPVNTTDYLLPQHAFDNVFGRIYQPTGDIPYAIPSVDVIDAGNSLIVSADLPGLSKEEIQVTYENNILTIEAKRKDETNEAFNYIRHERVCKLFKRQFVVYNIIKDEIDAQYTNGVLKIILPRTPAKKGEENRHIEIK